MSEESYHKRTETVHKALFEWKERCLVRHLSIAIDGADEDSVWTK